MRYLAAALLASAGALVPASARCQDGDTVSATLEAASDERRRGLSWSDGDPVLRAAASVRVAEGLSIDADASTLSGSRRHGGADAVVGLRAGYSRQFGGWRLSADAGYQLFPGASGQGYAEVGAEAGFLLGPASIDAFVRYAPDQQSIGGDNLYLGAAASVAVPGTPLTVSGHVGRSSGSVDDPAKARRLRPDGRYVDYGVALDYRPGRWFAGLRFSDSSIGPAVPHAGSRLVARVGIEL